MTWLNEHSHYAWMPTQREKAKKEAPVTAQGRKKEKAGFGPKKEDDVPKDTAFLLGFVLI